MIKGFMFDLDGTLVETHHANYEAYKKALEDFGVNITMGDFKKTIGHQAQTFLPWLAPNLKKEQYIEIARKKALYYKELGHLTTLNSWLTKFIRSMKPDHQIILVTTAKKENALSILRHHNLESLFDGIITSEDVKDSKPSPECYLLALKMFNLKANEVITFEDSMPGAEAAEKAGIPVVMVKDFIL